MVVPKSGWYLRKSQWETEKELALRLEQFIEESCAKKMVKKRPLSSTTTHVVRDSPRDFLVSTQY